ncbi:peptidoglycan DD-metalloendopeptidase family protein [Streptomyces sp. SID10815]|nr:peptidoglycan DD-metalloendopeptidase family protein [Streptomyces sp. SID10815]
MPNAAAAASAQRDDIGNRVASYAAAFSQPIEVPIEPRISRLGMLIVERWRARVGDDISIAIKPDIIAADSLAAATALADLTQIRDVPIHVKWDLASAAIVQAHLDALQDPLQVPVHPTFDSSATPVIAAHLDRLRETIEVTIKPIWDAAAADVVSAHIDRFREPIEVLVRPVWDTSAAAGIRARLAQLASPITASIRTDLMGAPFALAAGLLDRLARRRRAEIDVSVNQNPLTRLATTPGSPGLAGSGGGSAILGLGASVARVAAIIGSALPTIASLGQALLQVGPLAATAAPAVAMFASAFAAIKVGISGVPDAIKAAFQPATDEANKAASAAKQVESAQRSLVRAQRSLQDAQVQAAERVKQAQQQVSNSERELTAAQRDARQAQLDLTAARQQATRDLEDMNNSLKDSRLSEQAATQAVEQAELDLQKVRSDPTATQLQIQQAELAKQQATQSLDEQRLATQRLEKDTAAANKAGVDGSKTMVNARQKVADATQQVADRERTLAQAQADVAKAQADGQRRIADAQEAVADAARSLADAQASAAAQTSKLDDALAKLSPNARAFISTLQDMAPAWRGMKLDTQDALFAGIGARLSQVGRQTLPTVRAGLVGAAGELNLMGRNALTAVSNLQKAGTLGKVFDGVKTSLGSLSGIPGQLVTGFAQLGVAAQPAFDRMTASAGSVVDRVMTKLDAGFKSGQLEKSISTALDVAVQFGHVLKDLSGILSGVFKAAAAAGGNFFGTIGAALAEIRRIINMPEVQKALTQIFTALNAVAKLLAGALGAAIQALLPLLATIAPVVVQLAQVLGPVITHLFAQLGKALMPVVQALLPVITTVVATVANLVVTLLPLLQPIGTLIAAIITAVSPFIPMVGQILQTVVTALVQVLTPVINALIPVVTLIGGLLAQLAPLFTPILTALMPLLPPLGQLTVALLTLAMQVLTPLMPLIVLLAGLLTTVLGKAIGFLVPIVTTVIGWFTKFVTACTVAVKAVVAGFKWLFDVLLGHSIIPDIVNGTVGWFGRLWTKIKQIAGWIVSGIVGRFTDVKNGAERIWSTFWGTVTSTALNAWTVVRKGFDVFADAFKGAFRDLKNGIGIVWDGLKKLVASPIRFFVDTVYNSGLRTVWNATAAKIPGIPDMPKLPMPKGLARGGILPGWSTWRDGDDQLVPMRRGEGVYVSEVMRDPYEQARLHALNAAAIRGTHPAAARAQFGFSEGGIFGGIKSIGSSIADGVGNVLKKGEGAVRGGLADVAEKAFKPIKAGVTKALGANPRTWPGAVAQAPLNLIDKAIDYIRGKDIPPEGTGRWIKPVNAAFGTRFGVAGRMWSSGHHTGLDFPAAVGTKVVAVDDGTVDSVTSGGPYGKHVMVNHGDGLSSLYAHMSAMVAKAGATIRQGARVGSVGATGNVTGPHLHLEARINGRAVDPMPYLTGDGDGGSGVARWRGVVQQVLGQLGQSMSLTNTTLRRMNQESSGNPRAVNRTDSNWKAGHPSVGLMQVIEETYRRFAGPYRNTGPFLYGVSIDPTANLYASGKYALATYGSLSRAYNRPGGYSLGGIVNINRGLPRGYAAGGVIKVGGKNINTGPIAASVGADFLKQLAGTAASIDSAMSKVATAIRNAFKGVKTTLDDKLLAQIKAQTTRLDALAKQRDAIAAKINAANQLAADATGQAVQFTAMTSLPNGGNVFDAGGILSGLSTRLGQLKKFGANLATLAKRGLSKTLLQQIITAGPESGAAYAQALVDATPAQLKQINTAQGSIDKATVAFGKGAADAMYDVGVNSGKGYLTGLASTQKAIEAQMAKIAKAVQKSIKVELQIKSPSRVLRALGQFTGLGYAQGVEDTVPQAQAAAARMAGTVRATATATSASIRNQTTVTNGGDRHLHYNAAVREVATRKSILDALAIDDMLHRTAVVGG